jgi:hypothetical protein
MACEYAFDLCRYGVASRKPQSRASTLYPLDDEDEDKYKKKGIMQLFVALGLV